MINKFSTFDSVKLTAPSEESNAQIFIETIKSGAYKAEIDAIRSAPDKDTRSAIKARLPAVTASGTFSKRAASALIKHSGILIADLDLDDNPQLLETDQLTATRKRLCEDPHVFFLFASPSGGLKVGVNIDAQCADTHKAAFLTVKDWFIESHGLIIDKACSDVSRLCFLSHDPAACIKAKPKQFKTKAKAKTLPIWHAAPRTKAPSGDSPGDDFDRRGDVEGMLQSHGWTTRNGKHWTRPGKSGGISGTFGVVGERKFFCWTSSAAPLQANESYSPFALFATFYHGGDFSAAAEALALEGYGEQEITLDPKLNAAIGDMLKRELDRQENSFKKIEIELRDKKIEFEQKKREVEKMSVLDYLESVNIATDEALERREKLAREMVFVLPGIAARGQATVIYAAPNSGKTLITCHLIKQQLQTNALGDLRIVYCNFDDDYIGANLKGRFFNGSGLIMIDNQQHTPEDALKMMQAAIKDGTAGSMCFVLDTLIRFVSDSDKQTQRAFTSLIQSFVGAQGTIIALGHTNKHKDADGKSIHGGTSDIRNSFSQAAILELESDPEAVGTRQVRFYNDKLRGMAKCSNTYSYTHGDTKNWIERVETVKNVNADEAEANAQQFVADNKRKQDAPIIDCIVAILKDGAKPARDIIRASGDDIAGSQSDRARVLDDYEGKDWRRSKGNNGGWNYYLEDWEQPKPAASKPWQK